MSTYKATKRAARRAQLEQETDAEIARLQERRGTGFYAQIEAAQTLEELKAVLLDLVDKLEL